MKNNLRPGGTSPEDPIIGVATIVVRHGLILVGYDGEKKKYSFPGGHWEGHANNESFEDAAAREIFEETGGASGNEGDGVICENYKRFYDYTFLKESTQQWYRSIGFVADYKNGNAGDDLSEERTDWKFMTIEEALGLDLFEPARKGLELYAKEIVR
jgi:ADP-ribose pyrophosphatase YjhB (NUDIX family)